MSLFSTPPQSLCILRLSAIGDVCNALAAVQAIRDYWPKTDIVWIIGKPEAALLSQVKGIRFVVYDKSQGWKGILSVWRAIKDQHFDALLNMQTAFRASILSLGIRATYKIGFGKKRSREGQRFFVNKQIRDPDNPHVLSGFMAFAEALGVPKCLPHWDLGLSDDHRKTVAKFIDPSRKNLLISPCSSKHEKDWTVEGYATIANIANQHHVQVIFCSSPAKREIAFVERILKRCEFTPHNACGKTSLLELAALIGQVDLLITPDSGPAHIATTQNTPVIGLYAYHNPLRTGPYLNLHNVVSVYEKNLHKEYGLSAEKLPWATKLKGKNLMETIRVEEVVAKMREMKFLP